MLQFNDSTMTIQLNNGQPKHYEDEHTYNTAKILAHIVHGDYKEYLDNTKGGINHENKFNEGFKYNGV